MYSINFSRLLTILFVFVCLSACGPTSNANKDKVSQTKTTQSLVSVSDQTKSWSAEGLLAKTLPEISQALKAGDVSAEELVNLYLERITTIDSSGPKLQSVLTLNPDAIQAAQRLDAARLNGEPLRALHGVPILLKDNIESKDQMPTTAGSYALKDNLTQRDSPLVEGLRAQGAIILGKTNLSQWANFRSNESLSGWSALGGQVKNPHILDRNPCGSSSGSGAAVAASLAAGAVGTETNGSIICPATVNGVVGFKPTVGLVSQKYIVPISHSQDTAGPMTKTVTGAAMMLSAMAEGEHAIDFLAALDKTKLDKARIGVLRFSVGDNQDIINRFEESLSVLKNAGAELIEIDAFEAEDKDISTHTFNLLKYEFKDGLNKYLDDAVPQVQSRSLKELIAFNESNAKEMALFDQDIMEASQALGDLTSPEYLLALDKIENSIRVNGIDALFKRNQVDVLVAPSGTIPGHIDPIHGDVWPAWSGAGYLPAVAGYPHASVPMGAVHGLPIGLSFYGKKNQDADVLSYAFSYEQLTQLRQAPKYLPSSRYRPEIQRALEVQ